MRMRGEGSSGGGSADAGAAGVSGSGGTVGDEEGNVGEDADGWPEAGATSSDSGAGALSRASPGCSEMGLGSFGKNILDSPSL